MGKTEFDDSVFRDVKKDVIALLGEYPCEYFENTEAQLCLLDKKGMEKIDDFSSMLLLEYGYDERIYKKYNINHIVKIISPSPIHYYKVYETEKWKQINDRKLVFERLDGSYERYKNGLLANVKKKAKEKDINQNSVNLIIADIEQEIIEAHKKLEYIKKNFDILDVRISSYNERTKVSIIECRSDKKRAERKNLRKGVPNIIWFKKLEENEQDRKDNELKKFMSVANRAFGEIYYVSFETYNEKE